MKKYYFILAAAALGFASCSNDETIESAALSESNEIGFRAFTTGMTRAVDASFSTAGDQFKVTAFEAENVTAEKKYFANETFTRQSDGTFTSTNKHYWPSNVNLDFYAWQPATLSAGTGDYTSFEITPDAAAANQIDFVYAVTKDWGKVNSTATHVIDGSTVKEVAINFRHAESKIVLKIKNTNSNMKITVEKASICGILNKGTFTWNQSTNGATPTSTTAADTDDNTTGSDGHVFYLDGTWNTSTASSTSYEQSVGAVVTTETQVGADWILIPQTLTQRTQYEGSSLSPSASQYAGPCIKVNLKIQNNVAGGSDAYIVGDADTYVTAMWPIKTITWLPGHMYTFTVELSGGGYYTENTVGDEKLDPILGGLEIMFANVTVDAWLPEDGDVYTGATPSTPVAP